MEKLVLKSEKRDALECVRTLRASKVIPAVVYGKNQESTSVKVDNSSLLRVFRVAGTTNTISLELDGKNIDVIVKDFQRHPVTNDFMHVDFYAA